jgi:hypothetical protein
VSSFLGAVHTITEELLLKQKLLKNYKKGFYLWRWPSPMTTHDSGLEPEPTPQSYGFPTNPSTINRQCWDRQQAFLLAYSQLGTILHAAKAVGIHRDTVNKWISADLYSFKKRMDLAHDDYCDWIQGIIRDRIANPQGNRGSDVLVMFAAKAEMPQKYREEVQVVGVEHSKLMLDKLRELAGKDLEKQAALETPAVEAIYTEVSPPPGPGTEAPSPAERPTPPAQPPRQMPPKESASPMAAKDRRAAQFRASRAARAKAPGRIIRR